MTELNGALQIIEKNLRSLHYVQIGTKRLPKWAIKKNQQVDQLLSLITAIREAMPDGLDKSLHIFENASTNSRVYAAIKAAELLNQIVEEADD